VLKRDCVPSKRRYVGMNLPANCGPLSVMRVSGSPCSQTMCFQYAVSSAFTFEVVGTKCTYLVKRSTMTAIQSNSLGVGLRPVIKSIDTCCQG